MVDGRDAKILCSVEGSFVGEHCAPTAATPQDRHHRALGSQSNSTTNSTPFHAICTCLQVNNAEKSRCISEARYCRDKVV